MGGWGGGRGSGLKPETGRALPATCNISSLYLKVGKSDMNAGHLTKSPPCPILPMNRF